MRSYTLAIAISFCVVSCGTQQSTTTLKTIFDSSDIALLSSEQRNAVPAARAVGNMMAKIEDPEHPGSSFVFAKCTGIQISRYHVMTAGHCKADNLVFDKHQIAINADLDKIQFQVFDDVLRLAFTGELVEDASHANKHRVAKRLAYQNDALDVAIYEYDESMDADAIDITKATSFEAGSLMLFGHPNGVPLSRADHCAGNQNIDDGSLSHDCDALSGSSGGLIVNGQGIAIGMHLAGPYANSGKYYQGHDKFESKEDVAAILGCVEGDVIDGMTFDQCMNTYGRNKGVLFTSIVDAMKAEAPELLATLRGVTR